MLQDLATILSYPNPGGVTLTLTSGHGLTLTLTWGYPNLGLVTLTLISGQGPKPNPNLGLDMPFFHSVLPKKNPSQGFICNIQDKAKTQNQDPVSAFGA